MCKSKKFSTCINNDSTVYKYIVKTDFLNNFASKRKQLFGTKNDKRKMTKETLLEQTWKIFKIPRLYMRPLVIARNLSCKTIFRSVSSGELIRTL